MTVIRTSSFISGLITAPKIRFTSGTGSEALMGHAEQKSMLYLETRCVMMVKGAGSQGVQNGSISLIALPQALPAP